MHSQDIFSMQLRDEGTINARRRKGHILGYGCSLTVYVAATCAIAHELHEPAKHSWPIDITLSALLALFVLMFFIQVMLVPGLKLVALLPDDYQWLPGHTCGELADLCDRHAGLTSYRDKVRYSGRRFTTGEFEAMKTWASRQMQLAALEQNAAKQRAQCQRLYGIPDALSAADNVPQMFSKE